MVISFHNLGYEYLKCEMPLLTPLVIGLGNEHPTEKGFRFDWTLGVPSIPASSIKGVVRLAAIVNEFNHYPSLDEAENFVAEIEKGKCPEGLMKIFGTGGEADAARGRVIFMDAYPSALPRLKAEIMNCHYPDYFQGKRGPTEDQQLNPQKFWAIDPYLDDKGTPLKFVFRLLVHKDIAGNQEYQAILENALRAALEDHGLGAKTAIGHGRFSMKASGQNRLSEEPEADPRPGLAEQPVIPAIPKPRKSVLREIWNNATVLWKPNDNSITATFQDRKASCKGKELVPDVFHEKLFMKKKSVLARVEVEAIGNAFKIVKIEASA